MSNGVMQQQFSQMLISMRLVVITISLCFGNAAAQSPTRQIDASGLLRDTVLTQNAYWQKQQAYACTYQIITRDKYDTGISTHSVEHSDEVVILHGDQVQVANRNGNERKRNKPEKTRIEDYQPFATWRDPIFTSVVEHSRLTFDKAEERSPGIPLRVIRFEGDPDFRPSNDIDKIAQSLEGRIAIDEQQGAFVSIWGGTDYDVIDGKRFLMVGKHPGGLRMGIPLLEYEANLYGDTYIPLLWSHTSFTSVKNGKRAFGDWLATVKRKFMSRTSCEKYHVTSRILPSIVTP